VAEDDVVVHSAGQITQYLEHFAATASLRYHFAVDREAAQRTHLLAGFEAARLPGFPGADEFFLATADDASGVEEMHGVDDLVLQEGADFDHRADAAAAHQQVADRHAGVGAVVAHVADHPHAVAVVEAMDHGWSVDAWRVRFASAPDRVQRYEGRQIGRASSREREQSSACTMNRIKTNK